MSRFRKSFEDSYSIDPNTGCWLWNNSLDHDGYGLTIKGHRTIRAHILSYEKLKGQVPDGFQLDHIKEKCSSKNCINPDHLEPVTVAENVRRSSVAKLNWEKVNEIRKELANGIECYIIARKYNVSRTAIYHIKIGYTWNPAGGIKWQMKQNIQQMKNLTK